MHNLIIHQLGPVEQCELTCSPFMTFTGFQASGKSTIAKAIYYFRTIKEDILELAKGQALDAGYGVSGMEEEFHIEYGAGLREGLEKYLAEKFSRTFGSLRTMRDDMYAEYYFTKTCSVKISLKDGTKCTGSGHLRVTLSRELIKFLDDKNDFFSFTPLGVPEYELIEFKSELYKMFDDPCSVVYIPAGRSMITLLSQQFSYIYATMGDVQKRSLDSCTKDYLERILRLKPEFSEGLEGLAVHYKEKDGLTLKIVSQALALIKKILRGTYRCSNGEEQIILENGKYIKINYSSSRQQESVWILNLLFYYLLQQKQVLFIIEEPESHLFPESQKYMIELIAMISNYNHSVVLTTHSPYVLGTLNNLLYAGSIPERYSRDAEKVIPEPFWVNSGRFDAWFVKGGKIENCMDWEIHMIQNERIDEISKVINYDFDKLLELQETEESVVY